MDCREAKHLLVPHILGDLRVESRRSRALAAHLRSCRACSEEYQCNRQTIAFIETHKPEFADALESVERKAVSQEELERSWRGIETKLDKLEAAEKHEKRAEIRRILVKVSAAAACLAIGVFVWVMLSGPNSPDEPLVNKSPSDPASAVKIELLSQAGNIAIAAGQQISTSAGQLKTLTINDRHRLVLNANTAVSIAPLRENNRFGCMVNLNSGQIYARVEHDGKPFVVATTHGRAVINGTTFDIKATQGGTILVVAEGSVRFESPKGAAEVTSGQISEIITNSAPTKPQSCDTAVLTAWATDHEFKTELARLEPYSEDCDLTDLWLSANSGPIELERIDYQGWVEEKRPWFEREFPWIFQLQDALEAEGVEADYPQLLISSGDIWQFAYPASTPQQIPKPYLDPMLKAVSEYGFDKQWLLENISAAKSAIHSSSAPEGQFTGLKALQEWMACVEKMRNSSNPPDSAALVYCLHAGVYLADTRTLVWLSIANGKTDVSATDRAKITALLQTEVNTANKLSGRVIRLLADIEAQPCDECRMLLSGIIENIKTITGIEKGMKEHEGLK